MTKAELDLFHESRYTPDDIVDEAVFDPTSRLYDLLQNRCHNDQIALPIAIYHSITGTTYCYAEQLKQFFFVCPSYCPSNTMYVISHEPNIPHYVSNTIGIPYLPVPSLAQAAYIPPSLKWSSLNSSDVQTTLLNWPDQNYTPDARWDNSTFTTFNPNNSDDTRTQPQPGLPKLTNQMSTLPSLNILSKNPNRINLNPMV